MSANATCLWPPNHAHTVSSLRDTLNSWRPRPAARLRTVSLRARAHRDQAEVLGVELVVELGSVDGRTGEQPLHALVAAQLGRVGHALGLLLVLVGNRRGEVVKQAAQRPQHMAQRDPVGREVAVFGLLHDEVLEQRVAGVVSQQHPLETHAVARGAARLGDGRRRNRGRARAEPLLALLDGDEAVVHGLGDRGTRAGDVLEVLAGRRIEADIAEAGDDRLLELRAPRLQPLGQAGTDALQRGRAVCGRRAPLGRGLRHHAAPAGKRLRARLLIDGCHTTPQRVDRGHAPPGPWHYVAPTIAPSGTTLGAKHTSRAGATPAGPRRMLCSEWGS